MPDAALEHVHGLISWVSPSRKMTSLFEQVSATFPEGTQFGSNSLEAWCLARLKQLTGADSFEAGYQNPSVRALLAFGHMAFAGAALTPLPKINPGGPAPAMLKRLEPDFFPVLAGEIEDERKRSSVFAGRLKDAGSEFAGLVDRLKTLPTHTAAPVGKAPLEQNQNYSTGYVIGMLIMLTIIVVGNLKGDKK